MTDINFNFRRGGGAEPEILYGTVEIKPTLAHARGTSLVLPAPTKLDLVDGKVTATNVSPTPEPVDGEIEWAQRVKVTDRHGKSYEWMVGVPNSTTSVEFTALPRYFETRPPAYGQGPQGVPGDSATVAVGTVTGGATAQVNNSGTNTDAVLNFVLPQGPQGPKGDGVNFDYASGGSTVKNFTDSPATYPAGVAEGLYHISSGGWPTFTGATFVKVTTHRHTSYPNTAYQIISGYQVDLKPLYRQAISGGAWGPVHELAYSDLATTTANGLMSTADKSKLDGMELAFRSKNVTASPDTYPVGYSTGTQNTGDGWPADTASNVQVVTFRPPLNSRASAQWVYPQDGGAPRYRTSDGSPVSVWGEWNTLVTPDWIAKNKEYVTPKQFGAVGDGVTDDTAAIQALITAALASGSAATLPKGTFYAPGNLSNFWNIVWEGAGYIGKPEGKFPITPTRDETTTIYADGDVVSSTGDGLSWDNPLNSLTAVDTRLRSLNAEQMSRKVLVKLRGTFKDGRTFAALPHTGYPVIFEGVETGGEPVTTVMRGTESFGMRFERGGNVTIRNIRFTGFSVGFNGYGALMKGLGTFRVERCVAEGCDIGFAAINNVDFTMTDSIARNCLSDGFRAQYSSSGLWARCTSINNGSNGFFATRNAVAHLDYSTAENNAQNGLKVDMAARVACIADNFKKNSGFGVRTEGTGEWLRDDSDGMNNFNLGSTNANGIGPFGHFGSSRETRLYSISATNEYKVYGDYTKKIVTANTSNNVITISPSGQGVPVDFFHSNGQKVRVRMWGRWVGGAGTKTVSLSATDLVGGNITHLHTREFASGGGNSAWYMETDLYPELPGVALRGLGASIKGAEATRLVNVYSSSLPITGGLRFRVYGQLSDGTDSLELHGFELYVSG